MTSLRAPEGPQSESEALETLVQFPGAQFLFRAAESEARLGRGSLGAGVPGGHPHCLATHVREAALSGAGAQTPGWDFAALPALAACPRGEAAAGAGGGPVSQHSPLTPCLGSGRLCT